MTGRPLENKRGLTLATQFLLADHNRLTQLAEDTLNLVERSPDTVELLRSFLTFEVGPGPFQVPALP